MMKKKVLDSIPKERQLDFNVIKQDLDNLLEFFINKINREFPLRTPRGAKELFLSLSHVARNTFMSIRYICADKSYDFARKLEYSVSSIPLLRLILDEIFTVIFISDDLDSKISWYYKSGWREMKEDFDRFSKCYKDNPEWTEWLNEYEQLLEGLEKQSGITSDEKINIKTIKYFPTPSQMIKLSPKTKSFMEYLDDSFYRDFSEVVHLKFAGLTKLSASFFTDDDEIREDHLKKIRSDCVLHSITLVLCYFSEIELILNFNAEKKLSYLWCIVSNYWPLAAEIYDRRYRNLLSNT